jgi:predicted SprT family Zn-dependent metalloprotease
LEKLEASDLYTGSSLWRKYKEIRLVITHELGALLAKKLPGGQPPSGKSMSEILVSVRKDWFEACEKQREEKS